MTLTELARAYYSEGVRGAPIGLSQAKSLFLRDLRFGNGKFKPLRALLKRTGWYENKRLSQKQIDLIVARLGDWGL
jgi:hypothetical protein